MASIDESETYASNPGGVDLRVSVWLRRSPVFFCASIAASAVCFVASVYTESVVRSVLIGIGIGCLAGIWVHIKSTASRFKRGCAVPGVIVAENPMLLAVYTDASKGAGYFPVIKVVKRRVPPLDGEQLGIGALVPFVATYDEYADEQAPFWSGFSPEPVAWANDDPAVSRRVLSSFADDELALLQSLVSKLPQPLACGMYRFDGESLELIGA